MLIVALFIILVNKETTFLNVFLENNQLGLVYIYIGDGYIGFAGNHNYSGEISSSSFYKNKIDNTTNPFLFISFMSSQQFPLTVSARLIELVPGGNELLMKITTYSLPFIGFMMLIILFFFNEDKRKSIN